MSHSDSIRGVCARASVTSDVLKWRAHLRSSTHERVFLTGCPRSSSRVAAIGAVDAQTASSGRSVRRRVARSLSRPAFTLGVFFAPASHANRSTFARTCFRLPRPSATCMSPLRVAAASCRRPHAPRACGGHEKQSCVTRRYAMFSPRDPPLSSALPGPCQVAGAS